MESTASSLRINPYSANEAASASAIHGSRPNRKVSHNTPTAAIATDSHCSGRSRSRRNNTPISTLSSGLMKYPSALSTTWPAFTAQMYRPQLNAISSPLRASIARSRGCASAARSQPWPSRHSRKAPTNSALQAIRCSTICSDGTAFSRCQYSGITPHSTKVAAAIHVPRIASRRAASLMPAGPSRPWPG